MVWRFLVHYPGIPPIQRFLAHVKYQSLDQAAQCLGFRYSGSGDRYLGRTMFVLYQ
jgi:hypothetical protein